MSQQSFKEAYNHLNYQQREAVNHIDGPMLVIAGPGTGKTELLAIRVGHIINVTDTQAHNILCLTFTDAGAYAMRSRLLRYIGPNAYNVGIYTYHSFCNQIIQENIEYFGGYRDLQPVSDLERVDIMRNIIDNLPFDHLLKRLKGDIYNDKYHLEKLFETMKKENWTEEDFRVGLAKQKSKLLENPDYYYKRKYTDRKSGKEYQKGDLKEKDYQKEVARHEKTYAASQLLKEYNEGLAAIERFDYQDMILWVIDRFSKHDDLLGKYQERYQYILLDEYQDTNGAQNDLVFQMADYWESPNLFAVGDDDQSIYRFQGANMSNIQDFKDKYDPAVVVLEHNYRSAQSILDAATKVISFNKERLVNSDKSLHKNLIESRKGGSALATGPGIRRYRNPIHEEVGLINEIEKLISSGVDYGDIAIIYKEHKDVYDLIQYFSGKSIPINVKKKVDVLKLPLIQQLINILKYIEGEFRKPHFEERRLFEILHYQYFGIQTTDIARISIHCSRRTDDHQDDLKWRYVISDENLLSSLKIKDPESIIRTARMIEGWIKASANETLQMLVERIITSSGWLHQVLNGADKKWHLQVFNTFLNLVKEESSRIANYDLESFVDTLLKMEENKIPCPVIQSIINENGINFITAHSSKGLEFKNVFLIKVQKSTWVEKNLSNRFKYPYTLVPVTESSDKEDDRRLFFVAMTRAEDRLQISFSDFDINDKESESAMFIYETGISVPEEPAHIESEKVENYLATLIIPNHGKTELIDSALISELLKDFKLSATSLNKYLKCPLSFYFENVLRVPMARTTHLGYGNAMHYALEHYFRELNASLPNGPLPPLDILLEYFEKGMKKYHSHFTEKEFNNHLVFGNKALKEYYEEYHSNWLSVRAYKLEHVVDEVSYAGVPIKGKLDKLIIMDDQVEVVDYKTGRYKYENLRPPRNDEEIGGDYWRQIIFYKMLISSDKKHNYRFGKGTMDFLEKAADGNFKRNTKDVNAMEEELVRNQLINTYQGIQNHDFNGCQKDDCKWCKFVSEMGALTSPLSDIEHDGDE